MLYVPTEVGGWFPAALKVEVEGRPAAAEGAGHVHDDWGCVLQARSLAVVLHRRGKLLALGSCRDQRSACPASFPSSGLKVDL